MQLLLVDTNIQTDYCCLWKQERRRNLREQRASFKEGRNFLVIMLSDPTATAKADPRKTLVTGKASFVRVKVLGSKMGDRPWSSDLGCCDVWFYFKGLSV